MFGQGSAVDPPWTPAFASFRVTTTTLTITGITVIFVVIFFLLENFRKIKIGMKEYYDFFPLLARGHQCRSVLAKTYLGAIHDFEIWAFKVFFLWTRKKSPKEGM